jgi:hypothetical protein
MKRKWIITLLIGILVVFGCATIRSVGPGKKVALAENEAIVFGKVIFIENNQEKIPYSMWTRPKPRMSFFRIESEKNIDWGFDPIYEKDGSFYWIMPTGTYIIPDIRFDYVILPQVAFQVPAGADAFYLGVLKIDAETKQIIARHYIKKLNNITVLDEFDRAKETFLIRHPNFNGRIEKNLMIHDPSIPIDRSSYTQQKLLNILNAIGLGLLMTTH